MSANSPGAARRRMDDAVADLQRRLAGLRTGRAHVGMVADVQVTAWGGQVPLSTIAQVAVQPPRALVITPHDPSLVPEVERALADGDLGARPRVDGPRLRLEVPAPTEELRVRLARTAKDEAEQARVAIRLARRDANNALKRQRAAEEISEGKLRGRGKDLQSWTDERIAAVDQLLAAALEQIAAP